MIYILGTGKQVGCIKFQAISGTNIIGESEAISLYTYTFKYLFDRHLSDSLIVCRRISDFSTFFKEQNFRTSSETSWPRFANTLQQIFLVSNHRYYYFI